MQYWRKGVLLFQSLVVWTTLWCQATAPRDAQKQYIFRHLDNSNGLISNDVFSISQDSKGFMWIGTGKGLQRYDGLRFIHLTDTSPSPTPRSAISNIQPDSLHQRLLYNQFDTDLREWRFLQNKASALLPATEFNPTQAVAYSDTAGHWLLEEYNVGKKSADGTILQGMAIIKAPNSSLPSFTSFMKDERLQQTWISSIAYGLLLFDNVDKRRVNRSTNFDNNTLLQLIALNPGIVRTVMMDQQRNIWLITWSTLIYRYNTVTNKLYRYSLTDIQQVQQANYTFQGWASALLEDNHGKVWIGTGGAGLLAYDADNDKFNVIVHEPGNDLSIHYNYEISGLFQDREENIWLGTDRGISIFNPYRQYFKALGNPVPDGRSLPGSEITDIMPWPQGKLLVATWGSGVFICDQQLRAERNIAFKDDPDKNKAWCFQQDENGNTWIGCQHGFLHILNREGVVTNTFHEPEFEHSTIRCMSKDAQGNFFFGLHNGKIITWDKESKRFLRFVTEQQSFPINNSGILSLLLSGEDCWAGTLNGLALFDKKRKCFTGVYKPLPQLAAACNSLLDYNDSLLLTGFENEGLYYFNKRTKAFKKIAFDYEQLLWSAYALTKDEKGNIWFTTEHDICRFNPANNTFRTYHPEKGLLNASFYQFAHFLPEPANNWLIWTHTEVVRFTPVNNQETATTGVTITGLKVFDRPVFIDSLLYDHAPLQLSYKENFVSFEYSNLRFSGVTTASYYYRLKGIDKNWVSAGPKGYAGYTNLSPGKYTFEVTTGPPENHESIASFDIEIMAPFWQTTWFKTLCLFLIAGVVYGLIYWRFRNMRSEAAMKEQIAKTEMMALRAQMNPHFIFNCINGIDALILNDDKYQATIYLNKFAMLIRNILDSSKQNTVSISKDLETLRLYIELEQWRHENKFTADIQVSDTVFEGDYKVPPLVVQPYVENAILHGLRNRTDNKGKLTIEIFKKNNHLIYIVEDNGVGRSATSQEKQHRSYGMEISLGRLRLFNKQEAIPVQVVDLIADGKATGTRVEVSLKIQ
jgi:ligand-binding sensor domain-containing protein